MYHVAKACLLSTHVWPLVTDIRVGEEGLRPIFSALDSRFRAGRGVTRRDRQQTSRVVQRRDKKMAPSVRCEEVAFRQSST